MLAPLPRAVRPAAIARRLLVGVTLALGSSACGGASSSAPLCGAEVCGAHEVCDPTASPPACVCQPAYTGADCNQCAAGYVRSGALCVPAPLNCGTSPCGAHGTCVDDPAGDRCECAAGYAGRLCTGCAQGFQDEDRNGTCQHSCATAGLTCAPGQQCDDSSGTALCTCPPHATGRRCDECESYHYYRLADGPCVRICDYQITCSAPLECKETEGVDASCTCPIGSTGASCSTCVAGFSPSTGGVCARAPTPGRLLLATPDSNWTVLSELDPVNCALTPLRRGVPDSLAADRTTGELWARLSTNSQSGFGRYDIASGTIDAPHTGSVPFTETTTFDPSRRAIFWVSGETGSSGELRRLHIASGEETALGTVDVTTYSSLAYDAARDRLLGTRWNAGLELVAIQPETAAVSALGKPDLQSNLTNPLLTVDAAGTIWVLTSMPRAAETRLREMLAGVARRIGTAVVPDDAPVSLQREYYVDPAVPVTLHSSRTSGAEVVSYDSYGTLKTGAPNLPMPVRIETTNPDAFVAVTSFVGNLRIEIAAAARFRNLFVYSGGGAVTLQIAEGWTAGDARIQLAGKTLDQDGLEALSPAVRTYTKTALSYRRASVQAYFTDDDPDPPTWLVRVDPTTLQATPVYRIPEGVLQGRILAAY